MTRDGLTLWAVLAVGTAVRLAFLRVHQTIERDGVLYASIAEHVARSGRLIDVREQYHTFYPPGYPVLLAPVYALTGDSHRAGQLVSLAAGVALIALVYALGRRLAGVTVGLVGAALIALYPPLAHESVSVHTESVFAALLCLLLLGGLRLLERPGPGIAALVGALVGALYLVRPEGILLAVAVVWIAGVWLARGEPLGRVAGRLAAFALALLLAAAPYVGYLHSVTGAWLLSGKGVSYRIAESPADFDAIAFGPPRARAWRGLPAEASAFAERYLRNFFGQEGTIAENLSLLVVGLAAIGLAAGRWRERAASEGLLLCALVPLFFYPAFEVVSRWTEPYMAMVFVLAARGIDCVGSRMRSPHGRRAAVLGIVALLTLHYAPQLAIPLRYDPSFELVELRDAGRWIGERFGGGTTVMCRPPEIAYYARARWVPLPYADVDGVIAAARRAGAMLVIDELHTRRLRPELLLLLDGQPPPGLTLLAQTDRFPGRRVRVFAVNAL